MSGHKEPHIIGRQGEAPVDSEPGIAERLRTVAEQVDSVRGGMRMAVAAEIIDKAVSQLEELADELDGRRIE